MDGSQLQDTRLVQSQPLQNECRLLRHGHNDQARIQVHVSGRQVRQAVSDCHVPTDDARLHFLLFDMYNTVNVIAVALEVTLNRPFALSPHWPS
jgi:hypothetical protein